MRNAIPLLAALLLAGCKAGQDYRPPSIAVAPAFRGPAAGATEQRADWWRDLHDPVLDRLVDTALAQNLDLEQALARIDQARAGLRASEAARYPSGGLNGTAARTRQSTESGLGRLAGLAPGFQRTQNQFDINLSASWELDLAGGLSRGREAAAYDYQAAQADGAAARLSVAGQVSDAYIQLRGFQQRLLIAEQQAGVADRIARLVTLREQAGEAARRERDQAEATAAAARAAAPALRAGVEAQTNRLLVLLGGLPQSRRSDLDAPALLPSATLAEAGAPADLLRRRPDLIVAERRLAATHARVGVALAEYYPSFSLSAVVGQQSNFLSSLTKGGANMLQGAVGLRWRLFDFGRIDAEVAQARGVEREALAAYRQAVLRASEEVETRYSALIEAQAQAAALGVQIEALERARLSTEKGWTAGEVSLIELLQAERDLLSARLAQMDAMEASGRNWVAVRLALGG